MSLVMLSLLNWLPKLVCCTHLHWLVPLLESASVVGMTLGRVGCCYNIHPWLSCLKERVDSVIIRALLLLVSLGVPAYHATLQLGPLLGGGIPGFAPLLELVLQVSRHKVALVVLRHWASEPVDSLQLLVQLSIIRVICINIGIILLLVLRLEHLLPKEVVLLGLLLFLLERNVVYG